MTSSLPISYPFLNFGRNETIHPINEPTTSTKRQKMHASRLLSIFLSNTYVSKIRAPNGINDHTISMKRLWPAANCLRRISRTDLKGDIFAIKTCRTKMTKDGVRIPAAKGRYKYRRFILLRVFFYNQSYLSQMNLTHHIINKNCICIVWCVFLIS